MSISVVSASLLSSHAITSQKYWSPLAPERLRHALYCDLCQTRYPENSYWNTGTQIHDIATCGTHVLSERTLLGPKESLVHDKQSNILVTKISNHLWLITQNQNHITVSLYRENLSKCQDGSVTDSQYTTIMPPRHTDRFYTVYYGGYTILVSFC